MLGKCLLHSCGWGGESSLKTIHMYQAGTSSQVLDTEAGSKYAHMKMKHVCPWNEHVTQLYMTLALSIPWSCSCSQRGVHASEQVCETA